MASSVDILEHPSDVGFRARAPRFDLALDQAVRGLARIETSDHVPEPTDSRVVEMEADDDETLLVTILEECVYLADADDWLAVGVRVQTLARGRYRILLQGTPMPAGVRGVHVKAITWHQLSVARTDDEVTLTVFVDI